jgi:dTDP-4-dehydrorhamnose 3,5-epimerase
VKFTPGPIDGLWVIDLEPFVDHRGFFARTWCRKEFADHGMEADWEQSNLQFSPKPGTMRGLHFQKAPHQEVKLVRCTQGVAFDVAADLRPDSPTYLNWFGIELRPETHTSVWVPKGCAHGWLSLVEDTEVFYMTSTEYVPEAVGGIRYDDPAFGIEWPIPIEILPAGYDTWPFHDAEALRKEVGS